MIYNKLFGKKAMREIIAFLIFTSVNESSYSH